MCLQGNRGNAHLPYTLCRMQVTVRTLSAPSEDVFVLLFSERHASEWTPLIGCRRTNG
jgi:hypothetical protein